MIRVIQISFYSLITLINLTLKALNACKLPLHWFAILIFQT